MIDDILIRVLCIPVAGVANEHIKYDVHANSWIKIETAVCHLPWGFFSVIYCRLILNLLPSF